MNFKIIDETELVQGSEAWHKFRAGGIGGSEIAAVMNTSPYQTAYQLWQIKTGMVPAPDLSDNFAVKRGHALEPIARQIVNDDLSATFTPCIFQSLDYDFIKYSSDGYDKARNELIEIKALGEKNHTIVKETQLPLSYYVDQCQWALMITGCTKIHFVSYCQSFPEPIVRIEVLPDLKRHEELLKSAIKFWKMVETKTAPELSEDDFFQLESKELDDLADLYRMYNKQIKDLESKMDDVKARLKKFAKNRNVLGSGLKMFTSYRRGAIDYSKIPELRFVDVEQYRKPDSEVFYIKEC